MGSIPIVSTNIRHIDKVSVRSPKPRRRGSIPRWRAKYGYGVMANILVSKTKDLDSNSGTRAKNEIKRNENENKVEI